MKPGESKYSDATRNEIRRLWAMNLSGIEIANIVGLTKGQVMGIKCRMGLPNRGLPRNFQKAAKAPEKPQERPKPVAPQLTPIAELARILSARSGPGPSFKTCQWFPSDVHSPFRDEDKCGALTLRHRPYCAYHAVKAVCSPKEARRILAEVA